MKSAIQILALAIAMPLALGCQTEIDDKPAAEVSAATTTEAPAQTVTERVPVDKENSTIGWVGAKVTGQHIGEFNEFDGWLGFAGETPQQIEFTIDVASLDTDTERLETHLRSDDFFDIENHPTATFRSTSIEQLPAGDISGATHRLTGTLELRGVTKEVSFPATVAETPAGLHATSEFTINRHDWGVSYKGAPDDLIRDDVLIKLDLRFPQPGETTTTATPAA